MKGLDGRPKVQAHCTAGGHQQHQHDMQAEHQHAHQELQHQMQQQQQHQHEAQMAEQGAADGRPPADMLDSKMEAEKKPSIAM